jgi:DNA-binding NarL/FixJ family response regulator
MSADATPLPPTPPQRQLLVCLASGAKVGAIEAYLGWSRDEIRLHLSGAIRALGARSVPEAIERAAALGIIDPPSSQGHTA